MPESAVTVSPVSAPELEALRVSEARLRALFEQAPVGVAEVDRNTGRFLSVNRRFSEMLGYSADELLTLTYMRITHPDDVEESRVLQDALSQGRLPEVTFEKRYLRKDGSAAWVSVTVSPLNLPARDGARQILFANDISARKAAEATLHSSERRLAMVLDNVTDGFFTLDREWRCTDINPAGARLIGRPAEQIRGRTYQELFPSGSGTFWEQTYRQVMATGQAVTAEGFSAPLKTWFEESVFPFAGGISVFFRNISARKEVEASLRHSEHQLSETQRLARMGSWEWDIARNRVWWSEHLSDILGYRPPEGEPAFWALMNGIIHPDDRGQVLLALQKAQLTKEAFVLRCRIVRPDGVPVDIEVRGAVVTDGDGHPTSLRGYIQDVTERARVAAALEASERRHRLLFEEAVEGIFRTTTDGTIVDANPALARLLGHDSPAALVGTNIRALYADPEEWRRVNRHHQTQDVLSGERVLWRHRRGEVGTVEMHGCVLRDEKGEPSHYQGFVRDVTAEQQQSAALHTLTTFLPGLSGKAFFEGVAVKLAGIVGADVGFVAALRPGPPVRLRTLGSSVDGKVQAEVECDLSDTAAAQVLARGPTVLAAGIRDRFPLDPDLAALSAEGYVAAPLVSPKGQIIGLVGVISRKPISRPETVAAVVGLFALQTAAELERQKAEQRFSGMFEFAADAILITNQTGRIVLANRRAESMFGYGPEELLPLTVEALIPPEHRAGHVVMRESYVSSHAPVQMGSSRSRFWAIRKDGSRLPVEISLGAFQSDDGRLMVASIRDVSARVQAEEERSRLEAQLRQGQKMEALGTLAGGIAHDFNNLLAVIAANVHVARAETPPGGPLAESLDDIAAASSRAVDLVKQILTFSRRQPASRVITSVRPVLEEVARLLRATLPAGITIVTRMTEDVPSVLIDASRIHQVLMNLGTNAWHAIERSTGEILLELDALEVTRGQEPAAGVGPGRWVRIRVSDDGIGMTEQTRERVFEPFFTTKGVGHGTGLGLAVAHGIVADHGGAIGVESISGRGTTFSVFLPVARGVPAPAEQTPSATRKASRCRVLLLDDEEALVRAAKRMLDHLGYEVTTFVRPSDALDAIRGDPQRFDVVITDQHMPQMNGLEVARSIGKLRADLPVVMASGNHAHTAAVLAAANVQYSLDKPYSQEMAVQVIEQAAGRA